MVKKFLRKIGINIDTNSVYNQIINGSNMIEVNGKRYVGNNLTVINDVVYIDGKRVDENGNTKTINITIDADVETVNVDNCYKLDVTGQCGSVSSKNGDIKINGDVSGDVTNKNGDIKCGNISGDVDNKNGNIKHT